MAYDAQKAHEYYEKYKKKGLKKKRKKKAEVPKKNIQPNAQEDGKKPKGTTKKLKMYKNSKVQKGGKIMDSGSSTYAFEDKGKAAEAKAAEEKRAANTKAQELAGQKARITEQLEELKESLKLFSEEEKHQLKTKIQAQIKILKKKLNKS